MTAYADAKAHGYTGTREEFGQLLANAGLNLKAAETAKEGAEAAKQAAETAKQAAETAQQAAAESQKNTGTQAANAKAAADAAANAAVTAKQAQQAAETVKADAETAKANADTAASNAAAKATASANSAAAAKFSADAAAKSAEEAKAAVPAPTLDGMYAAMLDGTNTQTIFRRWWPFAVAQGGTKYSCLNRFAAMLDTAWGDKTAMPAAPRWMIWQTAAALHPW